MEDNKEEDKKEDKKEIEVIFDGLKSEYIDGIFEVEKSCFEDYWSRESFVKELTNSMANFVVALVAGKVVGYIGTWTILEECNINNVAVHPDFRGLKIGDRLMSELICRCQSDELTAITLEVRKSNSIAQNLYRKYGFKISGIRKEYYSNNREDAIIMWKQLK
ncbi:MAG: ribosomal protein S18-alanine N-acetyltransferase [Clostridioides sp.]|jgi:ribosomal-protein-alanine N-acetyltransferase|nr:ribosomal protein S18-alanine N-acetyltransferase [Clostridioides sp.]